MRKPRPSLSPIEALRKLARSGLQHSPAPNHLAEETSSPLLSLEQRITALLGITRKNSRPATNMIFFVMYDIESNKVRRLVAKYLIAKGCTRIQRSIFLADLDKTVYDLIKADLAEVQSLYDNHDSIIICPISTDQINLMHVIGQQIDVDIITHQRNTLFF